MAVSLNLFAGSCDDSNSNILRKLHTAFYSDGTTFPSHQLATRFSSFSASFLVHTIFCFCFDFDASYPNKCQAFNMYLFAILKRRTPTLSFSLTTGELKGQSIKVFCLKVTINQMNICTTAKGCKVFEGRTSLSHSLKELKHSSIQVRG